MSITTLILLVVSLVGGVLLSRFGLKFGLLASSAVVTSLAIILLASQFTFGSASLLFCLSYSLSSMAMCLPWLSTARRIRILLQPLPASQRVSVQTVLESIVTPLAIGVVGLMLIFFQFVGDLTTRQSTMLMVALCLVWVYASVKVYHAYRLTLRNALQKRRIETTDIYPAVIEQYQVLDEGLQSKNPGVVLYSLNLMADVDASRLVEQLPQLLTHPTDEVRMAVVQRLEQLGHTTHSASVLPSLRRRLADEPSTQVQGALCRTLIALGDEELRSESSPFLGDSAREIRSEMLTGLLRYGGIQGVIIAGPRLLALARSTSENERVLAAQIIGEVADPKFFEPLLALLTDAKIGVRNAAITASGMVNNAALWPHVAQNIAEPATRKAAVRALVKGEEAALPILSIFFETPPLCTATQVAMVRAVGQIGGDKAIALLWQRTTVEHKVVRSEIWRGLRRCGYSAALNEQHKIHVRLEEELTQAGWLLSAWEATQEAHREPLLADALALELAQTRSNLFELLTFICDGTMVMQIRYILERRLPYINNAKETHRETGDSEQYAYAQEILEDLLPPALKPALLPFLIDDRRSRSLSAVQERYPIQPWITPVALYIDQCIECSSRRMDQGVCAVRGRKTDSA